MCHAAMSKNMGESQENSDLPGLVNKQFANLKMVI